MEFNSSQQQALNHRTGALLVSAGAGSGKTAVLTECIANRVLEGTPVTRMLVVTYTNAAAAEMNHRIQARLSELAEDPALSSEARRRARQGVDDLPCAQISTLHSFCAQVLRRHFQAVGLDPAFRAADDFESAALLRQSAEEAVAAAIERGDTGFFALQEGFGGRTGNALPDLVLRGLSFLMTLVDPWGYLENALALCDRTAESIAHSPAADALRRAWSDRARRAASLLSRCGDLLPLDNAFDRLRVMFAEEINQLRRIASDLNRGESLSCAESFAFGRLAFLRAKDAPSAPTERIKQLRDQAKRCFDLKKLQDDAPLLDAKEQARRLALQKPQLAALFALIRDTYDRNRSHKAERGIIDFSDMEHLALAALTDDDIAREYRERFALIYIDEYQDASALQEALLSRITDGENLFCVGDVKQSIYSFRAAKPALFLSRAQAAQRGDGTLVRMNRNYRTQSGILGCVNDLFSFAMQGEIRYTSEEFLLPGRTDGPGAPVAVHVIDKADPDASGENSLTDVEAEALLCARLIRERVGKPLVPGGRNAVWSDFAVLLRTTASVSEVYCRVFAAEGIPAYADLTGGYFESIEIQVLLDLLRLCDNRRQDIPLLSVLRAGIGGFTNRDIAQVRIRAGKRRPDDAQPSDGDDGAREEADEPGEGGFDLSSERREEPYSYFDALCDVARGEPGGVRDTLSEKCAAFLALLDEARNESLLLPLSRFVEWLVARTGYADGLRAQRGGDARMANLSAFFALVRDYEAASPRRLTGFLTYVDDALKAGRDMGAARTVGGGESVRILSVHRSKGLEFPCVFLCGAGRKFNLTDTRRRVVWSESLGVCMKYFDPETRTLYPTLFHTAAGEETRHAAVEEELRVLYVALTRAREELTIIGTVSDAARAAGIWRGLSPEDAAAPLDWVMGACARFDVSAEFFASLGLPPRVEAVPDGRWEFFLHCRADLVRSQTGGLTQEDYRAFCASALRCDPDRFGKFVLPRLQQTALPAKVSVTALGRESEDDILPSLRPTPRFLGTTRLGAAAVGTATHTVLRHLDLSRALDAADVREQAATMVARGLLTREESAAALCDDLARFFASPLGQRMRHAATLWREKPFSMLLDSAELGQDGPPVVVQGMLDACFLEEDGWVLLDYKTDLVLSTPQETAQKHAAQLKLYARALQNGTGKPVREGYICLLRAGESIRLL